ncbi:MAG: hypothetical protein CVU05_01305 [Bacteroidetes bacterium HGW-Bacteroidetes-21]|jgi:hypothetical protein|nr:MAG: hypothetical protein CVU05_01305 [Bacteroidetes bacterium HGW-Bacteroidetes-21]
MKKEYSKWKDFLLKSSIPLEYEVMQLLSENGCVGNYEYTYLREDENEVINEFSYDIDASYIKGGDFFDLMIECKYRDPSTNWIFIPENYGGINEIESYAFLNPIDHFTKEKKFLPLDYEPLGALCGKGIEITSGGQNPKTITQTISQLSYAMAEKIVSAMEHQIDELLATSEVIFYNVPIIVTTANLYRLNENVTMEEIKKASNIEDVGTKEDCIILNGNIGTDLEYFNLSKFSKFINSRGKDFLNEKLKSFNKDIGFVLSVIAKQYSPQAIAVIQYSEPNNGFKKLFDYLNEVHSPSEKTDLRMQEKQKRMEDISKKINELKLIKASNKT